MYTTRYGRQVKKPVPIYTPTEQVEDDFHKSEYDDSESDVSTDVSYETEELTSESDADEDGNLADFVKKNNEDTEEDGSDSDSGSETDDA